VALRCEYDCECGGRVSVVVVVSGVVIVVIGGSCSASVSLRTLRGARGVLSWVGDACEAVQDYWVYMGHCV
jgi:Fe-S cluster biogenesis protein NfuA